MKKTAKVKNESDFFDLDELVLQSKFLDVIERHRSLNEVITSCDLFDKFIKFSKNYHEKNTRLRTLDNSKKDDL